MPGICTLRTGLKTEKTLARLSLFLHEMARVRFDHEPHLFAHLQLERVARGQGEMDLHFNSALHTRRDDYIALIE